MEKEYFISVYLDKRRAKANGKYPVKLRVFTTHPRKQKLYSTVFEFTEKDFASVWETLKPREEHKPARNKIRAVEKLANDIAEKLTPFSFTQFERKYLRNTGDGGNVIYQYNQAINRLNSNDRVGTASSYDLSLKSFLNFIEHTKNKRPSNLPFSDITPEWLKKYENYMTNTLGLSRTTVGIYLRPLRAVFNAAIAEKEIDNEIYPFGKNKFEIPMGSNLKKALSKSELRVLFDAKPKTDAQRKARDFWFFSYYSNGMNVKDIALLKWKNIDGDLFVFERAKTINTVKKSKIIRVALNEFTKSVIKKYGNDPKNKNGYIFPIISDNDTAAVIHSKTKIFIKFINQHLKKLAINEGLSGDISTYFARHSFTTNSIHNEASMEFVSKALGHSNLKITEDYFKGFTDEQIIEKTPKHLEF